MKFVTFNIRCDHGQDGENSFCYRSPLIQRVIGEEKPDILCFQEVLPHQAAWLHGALGDYTVIGCGRDADFGGEEMTVAFRRDAYWLLEMHTFWLSETPLQPGTRYPEQSSCPRVCTEAVLRETNGGRILRVLNTHLDHVGQLPRKLGLEQILRYAAQEGPFSAAPVILAGDFNALPESEEMRGIEQDPDWRNAAENIGITYHGYGKAEDPAQIDYIWVRGELRCASVCKWEQCENGVYLSDHYPVCAELV